jgi:hypothetical protein
MWMKNRISRTDHLALRATRAAENRFLVLLIYATLREGAPTQRSVSWIAKADFGLDWQACQWLFGALRLNLRRREPVRNLQSANGLQRLQEIRHSGRSLHHQLRTLLRSAALLHSRSPFAPRVRLARELTASRYRSRPSHSIWEFSCAYGVDSGLCDEQTGNRKAATASQAALELLRNVYHRACVHRQSHEFPLQQTRRSPEVPT